MTKEDFIKRLLELGFTQEGNEFKKNILVFRQNEELYRDMKQNAFDSFVNNFYDAIKEF